MRDAVVRRELQSALNARAWSAQAPDALHMANTTHVLTEACRLVQARSALLLGVGHAQNVDLVSLLAVFETLVLIDIDGKALEHAMTTLHSANASRRCTAIEADLLEPGWFATAERVVHGGPTVVASLCVLSQLIDQVDKSRPEVILSVRNRHVDEVLDAAGARGSAVFLLDFVSSDTTPSLLDRQCEWTWADGVREIEKGNFFTGLNPFAVEARCQERGRATGLTAPWRWSLGPRTYAIAAIAAFPANSAGGDEHPATEAKQG